MDRKAPSLAKEGRGGSKNLTGWIEKKHYFQTKKARLLEKETSLKAWIQVNFTGLPQNPELVLNNIWRMPDII